MRSTAKVAPIWSGQVRREDFGDSDRRYPPVLVGVHRASIMAHNTA
ncbi:hypothetical protein [Saccharothrix syringae]|nr:hypothetical protein [Saccharothrix syringae]